MNLFTLSSLLLLLSPALQASVIPTEHAEHAVRSPVVFAKDRVIDCNKVEVTLKKKKGQGTYGIVYEGTMPYHGNPKHPVAVKELRERSPIVLRSNSMAMRLRDNNLVRVYDICHYKGFSYVITEWVDGKDGWDLIHGGKLKTETALAAVVGGATNGLSAMHQQGLSHGDVKAENIMATRSLQTVKVLDYDMVSADAETYQACGTREYMSPEMMAGPPHDGKKTDVWAMGVTILYMVTGDLPWKDAEASAAKEIWKSGSHSSRVQTLYKKFRISSDLAAILADVFVPEGPRMSMSKLAEKIAALERFRSLRKRSVKVIDAREPPRRDSGIVCMYPGGNSTASH